MSDLVRLRPGAAEWHELEGEIIALDVERSVYLAVNRSGALLWAALAEGTTEDALADALVAAFDLGRDQAATDVREFLHALEEQVLLDRSQA